MALKRKSSTPARVDITKRHELSWNMNDLFASANNRFVLHHDENCEEGSEMVSVENTVSNKSKDSPVSSEEFPVDEKLRELIDSCDFYLRVCGKSSDCYVTDGQWHGLLGQLELKLSDTPPSVFTFLSCFLEHIKELWLYVDTTAGKHLMYIPLEGLSELSVSEAVNTSTSEASIANSIGLSKKIVRRRNCSESYEIRSALYFPVETEMPASYFDGLQSKKEFFLKVSSCNLHCGIVVLGLYALEAAVFYPNFPCDAIKPRRCHLALQHLIHHFHGINEQRKLLFIDCVIRSDLVCYYFCS